jgi:hypothetical protein
VSPVHPIKASTPMHVTVFGIVNDVSERYLFDLVRIVVDFLFLLLVMINDIIFVERCFN